MAIWTDNQRLQYPQAVMHFDQSTIAVDSDPKTPHLHWSVNDLEDGQWPMLFAMYWTQSYEYCRSL